VGTKPGALTTGKSWGGGGKTGQPQYIEKKRKKGKKEGPHDGKRGGGKNKVPGKLEFVGKEKGGNVQGKRC